MQASTRQVSAPSVLYSIIPWGERATHLSILAMGEWQKQTTTPYKNRHDGSAWSETVYDFAGLEITALVSPAGEAYVQLVEISSADWPITKAIKIGAPLSSLNRLDASLIHDAATNMYCGINNCIAFRDNQGIIDHISIQLYVD